MGKCLNCGHSAIFLRKIPCKICGKEACEKCALYSFKMVDGARNYVLDYWYVCSKQCMETLTSRLKAGITPDETPISETEAVYEIPYLVCKELTKSENRQWLGNYISDVAKGKAFHVSFDDDLRNKYSLTRTNSLMEGLERHVRLIVAQHLKTAGRFEDAAKLYERLRMYAEAGKTRAKSSEIKIKKTEVSLDLNSLLGQLKEGGITVVYRCPSCGGKLKVGKDASVESLKRCEHCGSEIETVDLAGFLKTALS